jgi:hypothetical protein
MQDHNLDHGFFNFLKQYYLQEEQNLVLDLWKYIEKGYGILSLHDTIINLFFIKQKIIKSCKWVGVWFCIFYLNINKEIKKVNICIFEWQNIISLLKNHQLLIWLFISHEY